MHLFASFHRVESKQQVQYTVMDFHQFINKYYTSRNENMESFQIRKL